MSGIAFDLQIGLVIAGAASVLVLTVTAWSLRRRGVPTGRLALHLVLRGAVLLVLTLLAGRPVWVEADQPDDPRGSRSAVVVLVDRSMSMSLQDGPSTRAAQADDFLGEMLLPALKEGGLAPRAYTFAKEAAEVDATRVGAVEADGRNTDLGKALLTTIDAAADPPLAVVALTDGALNGHACDTRALSALIESQVPFVGVGVGSETDVQTLSIERVTAPEVVPPNREFVVHARLEMSSVDELAPFGLLLLCDGKRVRRKTVTPGSGQRSWLESFRVKETQEGQRSYTVKLEPPATEGLRCIRTSAAANVRITGEAEFRVLLAQGHVTWDYKFIRLALQSDPSMSTTGLTRMGAGSWFHQDVKTDGELKLGLPASVDELAPFRVVVLVGLPAAYMTIDQQNALNEFCGEYGGGLLLITRAATFDPMFSGSPLEAALPIRFARKATPPSAGPPFMLEPTAAALEHPVFRIDDVLPPKDAWLQVPPFTRYAPVDEVKEGAQVWAVHGQRRGGAPLIVYQRYGAGCSAVICVEGLWRWRLAPEGDPARFDRFWRQLLRYLGEGASRQVVIEFPDQELRLDADVRVHVRRPPDPGHPEPLRGCELTVADPQGQHISKHTVDLEPDGLVEVAFRPEEPGTYTVEVHDASEGQLATRAIDIQDANLEFVHAARDMDTLAQWAALTGGLAVRTEDCEDAGELLSQLREAPRRMPKARLRRPPAGVNGWVLLGVLTCLGVEWVLRKRLELP